MRSLSIRLRFRGREIQVPGVREGPAMTSPGIKRELMELYDSLGSALYVVTRMGDEFSSDKADRAASRGREIAQKIERLLTPEAL
jgi:hypothetical protein